MPLAELIFILAVFVSTVYWLILYGRFHFYKEPVRYVEKSNLSIVIAGKNEQENILQNLPFVLETSHITEVIYIDDFSIDGSLSSLRQMASTDSKLKIIECSKDIPGKKMALTEGIRATCTNQILLTDADCKPASHNWAKIMSSSLDNTHQLILGYGPLKKEKGFVNGFSRFETIITAIQYFGFALYNIPYMGVGRNLAFSKELFHKINGYRSHMHIPSGDDDLLVQEATKHTNVKISIHPESFVYSDSQKNWAAYFKQKKRHMAVSSSYSFLHKILLSIHPLFHVMSFIIGLYLLCTGSYLLVSTIILTRWIILMILGFTSYKKLDGKDLILFLPIFDLMLVPYYLIFSVSAFNPKNAQWT